MTAIFHHSNMVLHRRYNNNILYYLVCYKCTLAGTLFVIIIPKVCVCYLKEGGVTLQLGGAERSHWTQVGPEVDVG